MFIIFVNVKIKQIKIYEPDEYFATKPSIKNRMIIQIHIKYKRLNIFVFKNSVNVR